ncbi:uncharacterized protein LOC144207028 [Stigmatopora nigra]
MDSTLKVVFLLAVAVVSVCAAQLSKSQNCLCQGDATVPRSKFDIKDLTIYPATIFCKKVEIIVNTKNGSYFCLKPKEVTRIITNLQRRKTTLTSDAPPVTLPTSSRKI